MAKKQFEVALVLSANDKASAVVSASMAKNRVAIASLNSTADKAFSIGRNAGAFGLAGAAILAGPLKAAADMEKLNVALKTSFQGNEKAATAAFKTITKFAEKTPYEMEEVLTSFVKLKNMGLDPSEDALTAYGNTASAMGKSLNDMIEAVADAATGEFERLKEFGIKSKSEGDKVTFTFQGVKTTVGKNSKEIEQYLKYIGNVKFAGGIEAQSKTFWGMFSTLMDGMNMASAKIGTLFLPKVKEIVVSVGKTTDKIAGWVQKNPELTGTIFKVVAGLTALAFATSALAFLTGGLLKTVAFGRSVWAAYTTTMVLVKNAQVAFAFAQLAGTGVTGGMTAAVTALNLAFLANPITWVIAGVVALIAVGYLLIKNWDKVKAFFTGLWDYVTGVFRRGMVAIEKIFGKNNPVTLIYNNWSKITTFFGVLWGRVKNIFTNVMSWVWKFIGPFYNIGSAIISSLWNGIKLRVEPLYNFVKGIGKKIADTFKFVLGIASPSKVFMEYGVNITEGASKGIQKGQSAAVNASRAMAKSVAPPIAKVSGQAVKPTLNSGGGKSAQGSTVNVTFAPVISGGANASEIRTMLKSMVPELIREIQSAMDRKKSLSFS